MAVADPTSARSRRQALAVLAACLACLLLAAPASAARSFHTAGPEFARAVGVAQAHWGSLPCGGQVAFGWRSEDPAVNATAYWVDGAFGPTSCEVVFNREAGMDWKKFCTVLTHELGHLHGHDHDHGDALMSATYSGALPACAAADPTPAAAPAPTPVAAPSPAVATPKAKVAFDGVFLERTAKRKKARTCARRAGRKRSRAVRKRCAARRRAAARIRR